MKRCFCMLLVWLLAFSLVACGPTDEPEPSFDEQASLDKLCGGMEIDEAQARDLLTLLEQLEVTGEVMFAYLAEDDEDRLYYHVWIGEGTVDVYLADEGFVEAVRRAGVLLYGELPPAPDGEDGDGPEDEPGLPTSISITVESYTATVVPGGAGYVRAQGFAGSEYKIKVYYAGGVSTAKALSPQTADEDGLLVWEWTVGAQVKPGTYKIVIVRTDDERDSVTLPFEVAEPQ